MTEITASTLLAEMKPAWRAALGDRVSHEYIAGFIRRNRQRLEAALDPIVAVLNAVPDVHVAELAEDVAKRLRGRSEIVNVLANAPHNFGVELDRQLPQVMLEYLPEGTGTPQRWAIYRRWSDDTEFRRQLRAQVYELLWERRPGWAAGASERAEERKTKETETRNSVRSVRLRSAATNLAHQRVQVAADSVAKLRHQDVERVLRETPAEERRQVAYILGDLRADLSSEIDEVMREVLGEPANWSEYGRQEIYEPGSRAKREATLAEAAAERFQQGDFNALGAVPLLPPSPDCSVERALEVAAPMIAEAEREIAAAKGEPLPVVMASLEAGGILLLSPLGFLGRDLFQTYRDATSRLQYVSYPKKGQRGIPKVVARAVLALERDGFEVRAETPEVVKSLIVTGGLDHALPVGPPPPRAPRDEPARPPTRTSDPSLIARVNALAADPPTSTLKYLVKTLRERGDLPLQVKDWKEGGWRPVETAIEEAEGKAARRLARKPKAERLRADGVERPAKDANEEHAAQALVQLANMDPDKARDVNEAGFSKSDVATGHTLARRWEATGELTGDEWEWAVAVANKYRRQVGPLPEPKGTAPSAKEPGSKKGNNPLSYAGHSLATVQDIAAFLKRSLGKLYERYMLNINVVRNVGDHSVMLTFYRVPPDSGELEAANAKCKVRINIHGAGRTNGSTWPDDATPAELTAYTVWVHNAPKFRKRTGPPSVIVAAVSSWFVLNIADLTGTAGIDDMDAQVAREEAAMGNALRAERDREEAEWSGAVRRGVKAEIANGHDAETAKRIAVANLGKDFEYYDKRGEEKWGERP